MSNLRIFWPPMAHFAVGVTALFCTWFFSRVPESIGSTILLKETSSETLSAKVSGQGFALYTELADPDPATFERPLLTKGRRPFSRILEPEGVAVPEARPEPQMTGEAPQGDPPPQITMHGYIHSDGDPKALLIWNDDQIERWYAMGAIRGDWHIVAIESQSVRVSNGTNEITVKMYGE